MKKIIFWIAFVLVLGGLAALPSRDAEAAPGDSPADPILIGNVSDLQNMNLNLSAHYALNNSINASSTSGWNGGLGFLPVGNDSNRFTGSFDGRGYTITGLSINRSTTDNVGLFGVIGTGGVAINARLGNISITGKNNVGGLIGYNYYGSVTNSSAIGSVQGNNSVGGLVGYKYYGSVTNAYATGTVSGSDFIGGLVGYNDYGSVNNSYATGNAVGTNIIGGLVGYNYYCSVTNSHASVTVSGISDVGGLVGWNYYGSVTTSYASGAVSGTSDVGGLIGDNSRGTVSNSYATGNVVGNNAAVGGLIGRNYYGSVTTSYATGNVEGNNSAVGGLVGENSGGTVSNSYATGNVKGINAVGGLVGFNNYTVSNSYSTGNVSGTSNVGGLVGENSGGTVSNSYATGNVKGTNAVGGLVGLNNYIVSNSFATGNVSGTSNVGGLVGRNYDGGTVSNSFYNRDTTGQSDTGRGEPRITADMKNLATFTGWSITESAIELNNGYPYLSWQLPGYASVWYIYRSPCPSPEIPLDPYPRSGDTNVSIYVTLNWSKCADASSYNVYLSTDFNPGFYDKTVNSSYQLPLLNYSTKYYWKVVANNSCGSTWGPVWNFSTGCAIPFQPQTPSPGNNSSNSSTNIVLSWAPSANASLYNVYLSTSSTPTYYGNTSNSSYQAFNLSYNTKYYWQVVANNSCGLNTSSDVWNFTTTCAAAPNKPQTPSPGNGYANISTSVTLNWSVSANTNLYDVYLNTSPTPTYYGNTSNSSYQASNLSYNTKYYWKVVAKNSCGNNSSDIWNFTIVDAPRHVEADIMGTTASWAMYEDGALMSDIDESSPGGDVTINISSGTIMWDESEYPLGNLSVTAVNPLPEPPLAGGHVLAAFDFKPNDATFDPGIQITIAYNPFDIPIGMDENDLFIGIYNDETGEWQYLSGTAKAGTNTITFTVTHFTIFAVLAPEVSPDNTPEPTPTLAPVDKGGTPLWVWIILGLNGALAIEIFVPIFIIAKKRSQNKRKPEEDEPLSEETSEAQAPRSKLRGIRLFKKK